MDSCQLCLSLLLVLHFFWYSTTENDALIIIWVFGSKQSSLHQSNNTRVIGIGSGAKGIHTHFQKTSRRVLKPQGPICFTHLTNIQYTVHQNKNTQVAFSKSPIPSMYALFTYMYLIFMVNQLVNIPGNYGWYGYHFISSDTPSNHLLGHRKLVVMLSLDQIQCRWPDLFASRDGGMVANLIWGRRQP